MCRNRRYSEIGDWKIFCYSTTTHARLKYAIQSNNVLFTVAAEMCSDWRVENSCVLIMELGKIIWEGITYW